MRAKFHCEVGITNVWREPQVGGQERIQGARNGMKYKFRSLHGSQKPLCLIEFAIGPRPMKETWSGSPLGGFARAPWSAITWDASYCGAEIVPEFYSAAVERLMKT